LREVGVPSGTEATIYTITASFNYRKIDQFLLNYMFGEDSGLSAPVVELERATTTVKVVERTSQLPEDMGSGAAWDDFDDDGRLDLVVTGDDCLRLFRNTGDGFERDTTFEDRPGHWAGASWADFDRDGDLDLYVTGYVRYDPDSPDDPRPSSTGTPFPTR